MTNQMPNQMTKKKFLRLRFISYPRYQMTVFWINMVGFVFILSFIFLSILNSYLSIKHFFLDQSKLSAPEQINPKLFLETLQAHQDKLILTTGITLLAGVFIITLISLFVSNKVVGPMTRLKNHFEGIKSTGEYSDIRFRDGDFFKDMPEIINNAIKKLLKIK